MSRLEDAEGGDGRLPCRSRVSGIPGKGRDRIPFPAPLRRNTAGGGRGRAGLAVPLRPRLPPPSDSALPKPLPNAKLNPIQHLKEARSRQPAASVALAAGWRDTQKVISNNASFFCGLLGLHQIFVLGHSMSEVDFDYYREIVKAIDVHKVKWVVTFYDEDERERHMNTLNILEIPNCLTTLCEIKALQVGGRSFA